MTTPADQGTAAAKKDSYRYKALVALADGYKQELVEAIEGSEKLMDTMHELISDFIDERLDVITDEDAKYDLGFLLLERVILKAW